LAIVTSELTVSLFNFLAIWFCLHGTCKFAELLCSITTDVVGSAAHDCLLRWVLNLIHIANKQFLLGDSDIDIGIIREYLDVLRSTLHDCTDLLESET
jgi:hypothetical protein